jgi:hypothetical protein
MEGYCSTGQSPQQAVVPVEEEEFYTMVVLFATNLPAHPASLSMGSGKHILEDQTGAA